LEALHILGQAALAAVEMPVARLRPLLHMGPAAVVRAQAARANLPEPAAMARPALC
jgi:hypothetical protein